jgi:hypothetical protein
VLCIFFVKDVSKVLNLTINSLITVKAKFKISLSTSIKIYTEKKISIFIWLKNYFFSVVTPCSSSIMIIFLYYSEFEMIKNLKNAYTDRRYFMTFNNRVCRNKLTSCVSLFSNFNYIAWIFHKTILDFRYLYSYA